MQNLKILLIATSVFCLLACETIPNMDFEQANVDKGRTLVLGGEEFKEGEPFQFLSWRCRDYSYGGKILVEIGKATFPKEYKDTYTYQKLTDEEKQEFDHFSKMLGFILYDGTDTGDLTHYHRDGLNHRWNWGEDKSSYSFVIEPDGKGLYYDFSTAKNGMKNQADNIFKCSR